MAQKRDEWDAIMRNQMELKEPPPRDLNFLNKDNKPSSEEQQAHNTNNNKDTTTTTKTPSSPLAGSPLHKRPRRDHHTSHNQQHHTYNNTHNPQHHHHHVRFAKEKVVVHHPHHQDEEEGENPSNEGIVTEAVDGLFRKMEEARKTLESTRDATKAVHLCALIRECASAIKALKELQ